MSVDTKWVEALGGRGRAARRVSFYFIINTELSPSPSSSVGKQPQLLEA